MINKGGQYSLVSSLQSRHHPYRSHCLVLFCHVMCCPVSYIKRMKCKKILFLHFTIIPLHLIDKNHQRIES